MKTKKKKKKRKSDFIGLKKEGRGETKRLLQHCHIVKPSYFLIAALFLLNHVQLHVETKQNTMAVIDQDPKGRKETNKITLG